MHMAANIEPHSVMVSHKTEDRLFECLFGPKENPSSSLFSYTHATKANTILYTKKTENQGLGEKHILTFKKHGSLKAHSNTKNTATCIHAIDKHDYW